MSTNLTQVPEVDLIVDGSDGQQAAVGAEAQVKHLMPAGPFQGRQPPAGFDIDQDYESAGQRHSQQFALRREGDVAMNAAGCLALKDPARPPRARVPQAALIARAGE